MTEITEDKRLSHLPPQDILHEKAPARSASDSMTGPLPAARPSHDRSLEQGTVLIWTMGVSLGLGLLLMASWLCLWN